MEKLKKIGNVIDKILTVVIIVLFLMMFGVTNLGVFMRKFMNRPIVFSVEMGRYCFASIIFLGAIFVTKADKHVHVDFFTSLMSKKIQKILAQIGRILMAVFFAVITYYSVKMAVSNRNVISSAMQISMAIPYSVMAFGCAGITVANIINIILNFLGLAEEHKRPGEGTE